ncbi:hypothetical protein GKZ90_0004435 [Flavobacterium sp. MC2016-06]|uniref:hypothetical protein n=1 Tax=Flavobacterium sp. MC2016-06 TaxID=2676308 RepID=UPI0012BA93FC|nr:hypothetical protein [Flavobacterium sp. MC2016-06]MBU3858832.1 hypothetical protein [Flavobacterium sp. MC2016-06]
METFRNSASVQEIEVKSSTSVKAFLVVIFTAIVVLMIYKLPKELFHFEKFNPNGIFTIAFLAFSMLCLYSWMSLLDNEPEFKISKDGFWVRKTIFPFSSLILIKWTDIKHVEYNVEKGNKGRKTFYLVIWRKENSKTKRINVDNIDEPIKEVLNIIRNYSTIMNYVDRMNVTQ